MLRNYPLKTTFGFALWFAIAIVACAIINYPVARILAYTSLIFYAVIQGWSVRETYLQELARMERKEPALSEAEEVSNVNLSPEKRKTLKIVIYAALTLASVFDIWSMTQPGISIPSILALLFAAILLVVFRLDKVKELQTAREITMGTSVIILVFVLLLPLSFKANLLAVAIISCGMYLSAFGIEQSAQKISMFTAKDFQEMEALERECYDEKYITPAEEVKRWYEVYPYTTTAYRRGNEIAGFINMFPVKKDAAERIRSGAFNDAELQLKDIASLMTINPEKRADMFLSCILVREKYQGEGIAMELLYESLMQYEDVSHCIDRIFMDAVTDEGISFAEKIGLTEICKSDHDSTIYEADYASFRENVLSSQSFVK